ncbi:YbhB/YbcL family Raf kinase inhibitor-like protein [Flavitalea sp. BT771]|uniref:YbhB/YbcL family Raf kinase inhibitor-like protein n=1 Tax=Flavitalea sp. BT771 TaxID=3063329 RepID=UPI0026E1625C|nr:YbhB/YbcL family Raf kinase inhibitor-like protein [Flavitalea sp. BT771]MDO6430352.1 YbhB/YbcL family Raf kinase inhibitor-like protein [Flavitalea sp. BT771]MDV6219508.1 YbhB/YbcL family Raf kinase inhibitor-like protein [Flavitalea sp. BT771]
MKAAVSNQTEVSYYTMKISSEAVDEKGFILPQYTCSGANISPPLDIAGIPEGTRSLAIIVDDPDAPGGDWVHWVAWNIPVTRHIKEARQMEEQGVNDFRQNRYDGPCPPHGIHHYHFKVYSLDCRLSLTEKTTKKVLDQAMQGHILGFGELIALYRR